MVDTTQTYIAVHDDAKIISVNEREFVREARSDGRSRTQRRPVQLHLSRNEDCAVATIRWGNTRVTAKITGDLVPPQNPDRPQEGWTVLSVDMSPAASTSYRSAMPLTSGGSSASFNGPSIDRFQRQKLNPILRAIERSLQAAIDVEALCVGEYVWKLQLSVTILQDDGNCMDAAVLAAISSLRHYRQPAVDVNSSPPKINRNKEPIPLPLHIIPLSITFGVIETPDNASTELLFLVDPTHKEELCSKGTLSIAVTVFGELCWLDYAGDELHLHDLKECHDIAFQLLPELGKQVDKALLDADEKALHERMLELQTKLPPLPTTIPQVPFFAENEQVDIEEPTDQEEEEYRRKALDYNLGHIATKVKETTNKKPSRAAQSSQLLQAMLKSVGVVEDETDKAVAPNIVAGSQAPKQASELPQATNVHPLKPQKDTAKSPTIAPIPVEALSDEEEPMMLKSEFETVVQQESMADEDDLAAAIKPKRKKKTKK